MANLKDKTKVVTNEVRLSYVHVLEKHGIDGSEPKYSVSILIPKTDTETVKVIQEAIENAKQKGKAEKWNGKLPANLKTPLRDGDAERSDDEVYAGHWFVNASSANRKPQVVNTKRELLTTEEEIYSGCYGKVAISFFPFNASGNKGIAAGLDAILKTRDGEPLGGGGQSAFDAFADDFEEEDPLS